jgi:hypothetical protein
VHEKRNIQRTRVMRSAQIIFSQYAVDCTILNLTNRGASLELAGSFVMPDSFEITP